MVTLLNICVALIAGLLMSRVVKKIKLPAVTGYLVAGILIGPYCLGQLGVEGFGFTSMESVKALDLLSQVALGFIAFAIGNEFRLSQLKQTGKQATVVAIVQAVMATILVDAALIGLHFILGPDKLPIPTAITLGAIATATAPAATLMVVRQYKAKGKVTDMLLPVVALDDAIGLVIFAISFGIAKAMTQGTFSMTSIILEPILEVVLSLVLGFVMGLLFTFFEKWFHSNSKRLSLSITFVILTVALSMLKFEVGGIHIGFSSLLVCMMLGSVFCNICDFSEELMERTDKWTAPLFVLFFVLSGSELELSVFSEWTVVLIGVIYIIARSIGKIVGAYVGAKGTKCAPTIVKYLGITLLPQAGVALGMSLTASQVLGADGAVIRNVALFAVLVYELVGPLLTKIALTKAGEITPNPTDARVANDDDDDE